MPVEGYQELKMQTAVAVFITLVGLAWSVRVDTKYGPVRGQSHTLHNGQDVNSFLAVRYAKAPVDDLRFEKPQEPEPWTEEFPADTLGPACMQDPVGLLWLTHFGWNRYSEDCLHMNIYTPAEMEGGSYPVMVWFHGGGYTSSANIQYPGYFLASRDVVVVVVNYRLGIFGFGSTGDDVAPGNYGMWDQNLGLKFVQENIANFGGDPNRVTIFGQSAGASSSGLHVTSPESRGLFHQAIYHSGNEITLWALNYPEANPEDYIRQVARNNECPEADDSQGVIDCLRALPADELRENSAFDCAPGYFCMGFAPVVDGEGGFMPKPPQEYRAEGDFAKVPLLAGQCNKDGSLYTIAFIPESGDGGFNRTTFLDIIRNRLVDYFSPRLENNCTVEDVFQAINFFYTPWADTEDLEANRQAFNDMITDVGFGYTGDIVYKSQAEEADVYQYVLAYRSANAAELIPEWLGVPHNGELPYVWGYSLLQLNPSVRAEAEMFLDVIEWDELDIEFAEYVQDMWANFAKFGNPTPDPVDAPDGSQTSWQKFNKDDQNYLYMNNTMEYRKDYNQKNFAFWRDYMSYVGGVDTVFASERSSQNSDEFAMRMRSDLIERTTTQFVASIVSNIFTKTEE